MTGTVSLAKEPIVETLSEQWAAISELLSTLTPGDWATPSGLPGWSVQDVVAHLVGTESMLLGEQAPEASANLAELPHVHNAIAVANEQWVQHLRGETPERMIARFDEVTDRRRAQLAAMSQEDFDAPSWTPAGQGTYATFMRIRVFDCWMHEQDIRFAVGRAGWDGGRCAELAFEQIVAAMGFLVGKRAGAPQGSRVTVSVTGPVVRDVHVVVDGRAEVVDELPGPATSVVRLSSTLLARLAGGRVDPANHVGEVTLSGDRELGERIVRSFAFTI